MRSNKPATPNAAMTLQFQVGTHWRGVADLERSAFQNHIYS